MESFAVDLAHRLVSQLVDAPVVAAAMAILALAISGTAGRMAIHFESITPRRDRTPTPISPYPADQGL